jgi:hypothetical protein
VRSLRASPEGEFAYWDRKSWIEALKKPPANSKLVSPQTPSAVFR